MLILDHYFTLMNPNILEIKLKTIERLLFANTER